MATTTERVAAPVAAAVLARALADAVNPDRPSNMLALGNALMHPAAARAVAALAEAGYHLVKVPDVEPAVAALRAVA